MKKRVDDLIAELEALGDKIRPDQWKALQSLRNAALRLADDEAAPPAPDPIVPFFQPSNLPKFES